MATMDKISAEYITPFVDATVAAFATMADLAVENTEISIKDDAHATFDISGIIGLAGEVIGSVVLSFPRSTACKAVSRFLDTRKVTLDPEVQDAVGELTNIVAGGAKRELSTQGAGFKIGIPSVVVGQGHAVVRPKNIPTICVHFNSEEGEFVLEVCLKRADGSGSGSLFLESS